MGAQVSAMTPSAIQAGSRGAREARASHSRTAPPASFSHSSMSAISRQTRTDGRSSSRGCSTFRALAKSRAAKAALATAMRASGSRGVSDRSFSARASRSRALSPMRTAM